MTFHAVALWTVVAAGSIVAAAAALHLLARRGSRNAAERQRDLEGTIVYALQAGTVADEMVQRLGREPRALVRRSIAHALRSLGEPYLNYLGYVYDQMSFPPEAKVDLASRDWRRRAEAALELGALRRTEALPELLRLLRDPSSVVRIAATRALCDIGSPETIRPILEAIPVSTRWAISDAVEFVVSFGDLAAPALLQTLVESPSRPARLAAIEALGEFAYAGAYDAIETALEDPDLEFRVTATRALGRIGGAKIFSGLGRAMKDPAWQVRAAAARALGSYRDPRAVALLETGLIDPAWWVRLNSAEGLSRQEARGQETLRKNLKNTDTFARDVAAQMLQNLQPGGAS